MIRVAISGYGNLGRGVECAVNANEDMELVGMVLDFVMMLKRSSFNRKAV